MPKRKVLWSKQYLENTGNDGPNVGSKLVSEGERQIDEHHDVAVPDVRSNVYLAGCLHHIWHQLVQLLHSQSSHHLSQTFRHKSFRESLRANQEEHRGTGGRTDLVRLQSDPQSSVQRPASP